MIHYRVSYSHFQVQRIPRYILLLNDLLKHTWPEHVDYGDLRNAVAAMENVAEYINERTRVHESITKITDVEKRLKYGSPEHEPLSIPSRRYIREDWFYLLVGGKKKDRCLFLFNDKLIVTRRSSRINNKQKVLISFPITKLEVKDTERTYSGML